MGRQGEQPADDSLDAPGLDATADCREAQQCRRGLNVMKEAVEGEPGMRISPSDRESVVDGEIDGRLREVPSLPGVPQGIGSSGRTGTVVKRRRSVPSRWLGSSSIDPRPSAGEPCGMD